MKQLCAYKRQMAVCHFFIIIDKGTCQSTGHALYIDKHVLYATELWDYTRDSHHTTTTTLEMIHAYIQVADIVHM